MKGAKDWSRHFQKVIQVVINSWKRYWASFRLQEVQTSPGGFTLHPLTGCVKDRQFQVLEGIWRNRSFYSGCSGSCLQAQCLGS